LDRQINGLSDQIDRTTVDLLLAQDALEEKRAVLERRLVDIYKRGPLYAYQVLLAAETFGDLLSRYKYLFLVSQQDRLLKNDMSKLRNRIARERQTLVDARDALGRRKTERTDELQRYLTLEHTREASLRETRRSAREAAERLSQLERDERGLNDRVAALERARREAEARAETRRARPVAARWPRGAPPPSLARAPPGAGGHGPRTPRQPATATALSQASPAPAPPGPVPPPPPSFPEGATRLLRGFFA